MTRRPARRLLLALSAAILASGSAACDNGASVRTARAASADSATAEQRAESERARQDSIVRARPGYIVDSILPVEEQIRRFRATLGTRPGGFSHGAATRQALVAQFVRAIERNDTTALTQLVVDRDEFGYLVYPTSPNVASPYRQAPDLVWLMRSAGTEKAVTRLMARFGGRPLGFVGHSCATPRERQGENTVWSRCVVRRAGDRGDTTSLRMFGSIIQRGGQFKFLSLSNGL
jgi:hypothetical protein